MARSQAGEVDLLAMDHPLWGMPQFGMTNSWPMG